MAEASGTATMWRHRRLQLERVEKFMSTVYFSDVNLTSQLNLQRTSEGVTIEVFSPRSGEHPVFAEAKRSKFVPCKRGDSFGPSWSTHWFRIQVHLPVNFKGQSDVLFEFDCGAEGLVWTEDGRPVQGLTGGDGTNRRAEFPLAILSAVSNEESFAFFIELACNGLFGVGANGMITPPDPNRTFSLKTADLVKPNPDVRGLIRDLEIIDGMARHLPESSERAQKAIFAANAVINACWPSDPDSVKQAASIAREFLSSYPANACDHELHFMGHCHIDTAWLWTYRETKRKAGRSWASQLRLMENFPEYTFVCSQAQQLDWVANDYPSLFAELQQKAKTGQFIPIGGTWIEMDCNIPNGESLVRQFLFGQRFFQKNFGSRCRVFWLPDTFGYAAQLPQILQSAGCEFFVSQKMSWNLINTFPFTSFHWQGLDGSSVLAHFPPADTYNGQATVQEALFAVTNNKDRDRTSVSLQLIGNGDGGGGPQTAMLDRVRRMNNTAGLPRMKFSSPNAFFEQLKQSPSLNTWSGELYLELHRGTYTTQAFVKKSNRKMEKLLHDIELVSCLAHLRVPDFKYPRQQLDKLWKEMLLQQFHDVIPGTSIALVYKDVQQAYDLLSTEGSQLFQNALDSLKIELSAANAVIYNGLSWTRDEIVSVASDVTPADVLSQPDCKRPGNNLVYVKNILPLSVSNFVPQTTVDNCHVQASIGEFAVLSNAFTRAAFNNLGQLVQWHFRSKDGQEWNLLPNGLAANVLAIYEDIPLYWDAWDVELYHREKRQRLQTNQETKRIQVIEHGPLRASLAVTLSLSSGCHIEQIISLSFDSPLLQFDTKVTWNENRRILKAEFAMEITTDHAVYETQFGQVRRPVHPNTTWEAAKFEVCGHRYAALCEENFGIALLNDCKYGHSVLPGGKGLALSLLRAPKAPDDTADIGHHEISYGLLPFHGLLSQNNVLHHAAAFNAPLFVSSSSSPGGSVGVATASVAHLNTNNVVIDTVKIAEDSDRVVLRLYECYGGRSTTSLSWTGTTKVADVIECNILEDTTIANLAHDGSSIQLSFKPFEIRSISIAPIK